MMMAPPSEYGFGSGDQFMSGGNGGDLPQNYELMQSESNPMDQQESQYLSRSKKTHCFMNEQQLQHPEQVTKSHQNENIY